MSARRYRINSPTAIHDTIDREVVIINFDTGTYYSLDGAGAFVWGLIEAGAGTDQIAEHVVELDRARSGAFQSALVAFLSQLEDEGLIVAASDDVPAADLHIRAQSPVPVPPAGTEADMFTLQKFTDMNQLLLLDPIHEVDEAGWPHLPADGKTLERTGNVS